MALRRAATPTCHHMSDLVTLANVLITSPHLWMTIWRMERLRFLITSTKSLAASVKHTRLIPMTTIVVVLSIRRGRHLVIRRHRSIKVADTPRMQISSHISMLNLQTRSLTRQSRSRLTPVRILRARRGQACHRPKEPFLDLTTPTSSKSHPVGDTRRVRV